VKGTFKSTSIQLWIIFESLITTFITFFGGNCWFIIKNKMKNKPANKVKLVQIPDRHSRNSLVFIEQKFFLFSFVLIVIFYWTSNVTSSMGIKGITMQLLLDWIEDESNFKWGKVIEIFAFDNLMSLRCIGGDIKRGNHPFLGPIL